VFSVRQALTFYKLFTEFRDSKWSSQIQSAWAQP